ncbi:MAG: ABC transporter permease subunit [Leeuwenhoekiella sp.]
MLRLLEIELHKLRYSKSSKVLTLIYFGLLCCIAFIASIEFSFGDVNIRIADQGIFNFPFIWHFNTYVASLPKIFLAIVIVSIVSNEYSNRTLKQNLIDGMSKKEFILSKFFTVILFAAVSTVFVFLVSLILGLTFSDYTETAIIFSDLEFILAFFFKLLGFFSFCVFAGVLVKRSAFALGFLFVWWIFETIIVIVLKINLRDTEGLADKILQFLPLEAMGNLINQPFERLDFVKTAAQQLNTQMDFNYGVYWYEVLIVSVWTFIFIYSSYALLKKRDL